MAKFCFDFDLKVFKVASNHGTLVKTRSDFIDSKCLPASCHRRGYTEFMPASVLQINVSNGGMPKRPIPEGVVTATGVIGDRQAHPQVHGGPRQALLLITNEGLEELRCAGFPLYPGALGENVTTQGLDRRSVRLGQRYRLGEVIVEVTKMRRPCEQLNPYGEGAIQSAVFDKDVKAGNIESPRWGLAGFYASVIQGGTLRPGDPIVLLEESC